MSDAFDAWDGGEQAKVEVMSLRQSPEGKSRRGRTLFEAAAAARACPTIRADLLLLDFLLASAPFIPLAALPSRSSSTHSSTTSSFSSFWSSPEPPRTSPHPSLLLLSRAHVLAESEGDRHRMACRCRGDTRVGRGWTTTMGPEAGGRTGLEEGRSGARVGRGGTGKEAESGEGVKGRGRGSGGQGRRRPAEVLGVAAAVVAPLLLRG